MKLHTPSSRVRRHHVFVLLKPSTPHPLQHPTGSLRRSDPPSHTRNLRTILILASMLASGGRICYLRLRACLSVSVVSTHRHLPPPCHARSFYISPSPASSSPLRSAVAAQAAAASMLRRPQFTAPLTPPKYLHACQPRTISRGSIATSQCHFWRREQLSGDASPRSDPTSETRGARFPPPLPSTGCAAPPIDAAHRPTPPSTRASPSLITATAWKPDMHARQGRPPPPSMPSPSPAFVQQSSHRQRTKNLNVNKHPENVLRPHDVSVNASHQPIVASCRRFPPPQLRLCIHSPMSPVIPVPPTTPLHAAAQTVIIPAIHHTSFATHDGSLTAPPKLPAASIPPNTTPRRLLDTEHMKQQGCMVTAT